MTPHDRTPEQQARMDAFMRKSRRQLRLTALFQATLTAVNATVMLWLLSRPHPAALVYAVMVIGNVTVGVSAVRNMTRTYDEDLARLDA